jgi:hypothetical protein
MAVRLWALRVGRPLPPRRFLVLISLIGWIDPRAKVRLEGLGQMREGQTNIFVHYSDELSRNRDGLRAEQQGFNSQQRQEFSLLHSVQTTSGAHPASYTISTRVLFAGLKLATHLHLVTSSRMVELYLHSPTCLHGNHSPRSQHPFPLFGASLSHSHSEPLSDRQAHGCSCKLRRFLALCRQIPEQ